MVALAVVVGLVAGAASATDRDGPDTRSAACGGGGAPRLRAISEQKGPLMATLDMNTPGELRLVLRGAAENVILNTLRRWQHWLSVEVERDPADGTKYLSVTLIADNNQESAIREILWRSFRMTFPSEGGNCSLATVATSKSVRRGPGLPRG